MNQQVLLDKLSEFLAVEQAGAQLYRVVASRTTMDELRQKYIEFGKETEMHREILVKVITAMGGDPNYISPMARVAQHRGEDMLCLALKADGLSPEELDCVDLESVILAETKDHADWSLLQSLVDMIPDEKLRGQVQDAVATVEAQEDEHLGWAKEKAMELSIKMLADSTPEPSPERWQQAWSGPHYTLDQHPAPIEKGDGLLKPATMPAWVAPPVARDVAGIA